MSLTIATLSTGLVLAALGGLLLYNGPAVGATARALPRSRRAAWLFFGLGAVWFLWTVAHLGEADQILPRPLLLALFGLEAVLCFKYAADFLAVRGFSIVAQMIAAELLEAAFMERAYPQRKFLPAIVYLLMIVPSLYLAGYPYRLRDFFGWLFARPARPRVLGGVFAAYGLLLTVIAFTY